MNTKEEAVEKFLGGAIGHLQELSIRMGNLSDEIEHVNNAKKLLKESSEYLEQLLFDCGRLEMLGEDAKEIHEIVLKLYYQAAAALKDLDAETLSNVDSEIYEKCKKLWDIYDEKFS